MSIGAVIVDVFVGLVSWLLKYFTQKMAVTVGIVSIMTMLIMGVYIAARSALALVGAGAAGISPTFGAGVGMVISPRVASLVTSYIAFWSLLEVYKWKFTIVQMWSRST